MSEAEERDALRQRRLTLERQTAELASETERLRNTPGDLAEHSALIARIKQHEAELRAFDEALEAFHARFGPLGSSAFWRRWSSESTSRKGHEPTARVSG